MKSDVWNQYDIATGLTCLSLFYFFFTHDEICKGERYELLSDDRMDKHTSLVYKLILKVKNMAPGVSDCCLMPTLQFISNIMAKKS